MPSTYTLNNGIELIATGEQSGTWGDTTNTNLQLLDTALDGQVTVTLASAGTSGSPNTLPISDGAASNGRNRLIIFNDSSDLGATAYVQLTPNDAEKIIYVRNSLSGSRSILLFQGTYNASNDYEVPAGTTAIVYFNGGGAGAVAANVFNNAYFDSLRLGSVSVTAILDEDNMASDSATALATQQSIKAYVDTQVGANNELSEVLANGNTSGGTNIQMTTTDEVQFRDTALKISSSADGQLDIDADTEVEIVAPTLDIDASTAVTINTATMTMTGSVNVVGDLDVDNLNINGNTIISTDTNGNIALTPNGTGEVDISKVDIDGGTIDGTTIGASSAAAITGTTITGTSFVTSGDMTFGDNDKAIFGAGSDLQIYHDGSNSIINDNGTGALQLQTGGSTKLATTATGVDITGGFTATSGSTITTADNTTQLTLISTDEDASEGPRLDLRRDSASPAAGDLIGTIRYLGDDDAGTVSVYGEIQLEADTVTAGATDGQMRLMIRNAGNLRNALTLDKTQNIFNDSGDDVDFRIESTGNTHAFFFEGSSGNVGIGASSPSYPLDIRRDGGGATVTARLYNDGTLAADDASLRIGIAGTTGQSNIFFGDGGSATVGRLIYDHNNDAMVTYVNGSEAMRIDSSGNVGIGTNSPTYHLDVQTATADAIVRVKTTNTGDADALFIADANDTGEAEFRMYSNGVQKATLQWTDSDQLNLETTTGVIDIQPAGNNVMRIQDNSGSGRVGIENAAPAYTLEVLNVSVGGSGGEEGFGITPTAQIYSSTNSTSQFYMNDSSGSAGTHNYILFRYQGSTIGDIDTTDNTTVRYNTFVGAHWSQTAATNVLKGSIMSTIDEMMQWTDFEFTNEEGDVEKLAMAGHADYVIGQEYTIPCDEDGNTVTATAVGQTTDKRLAKVKVSDVASDRSVYGVFGGQYADGDVSVESLGASFVRIGSGVTVQNGDLIESAGDGTGRVQADDIMRSCTVAKITSTIAKETFDDGSKLYPCTLHCG